MNSKVCENQMIPYLAKITNVKDLATDIKLLSVELMNGGDKAFRDYSPGQFAFLSAFGVGEAPFGIASTVDRGNTLEFAIQRLGSVTTALHELGEGDIVGVRGPMGNSFPLDYFHGKNLVVIGGGIGGAPLRPIIHSVLDNREFFGHFSILWAARHPSLLVFTEEYENWRAAPDTELHLTVDQADKLWGHNVGLITDLLEKVAPNADNTIAIMCGPPIMIHFTGIMLAKLGFQPEQCYVTLEARMHCGLGKCGRCNLGEKLICVDGPVFSMAEVGQLLESFM
jgi:sulfhydrogenase subunit gamma (sulfur reductase)